MAFVQAKTMTNDGSSSTLVATFDSNVTVGNLIYVLFNWYQAAADANALSVADGLGSTYALIDHAYNGTIQVPSETWYAKNIAGGACTVTATLAASKQFRRMIIVEYSGLDTVAPMDQHAKIDDEVSTTGTDGEASASITPSVNGCLIVGGLVDASAGQTINPGTDYSERADLTDLEVEDKVQATAASVQATWTLSSSTDRLSKHVVSFKPSAGPAGLINPLFSNFPRIPLRSS